MKDSKKINKKIQLFQLALISTVPSFSFLSRWKYRFSLLCFICFVELGQLSVYAGEKEASIIYLPEIIPILRTVNPISEEVFQRFEHLKKTFNPHSNGHLTVEDCPIFDVVNPVDNNRFIILGTYHDLLFESFSPWLNDLLDTIADEVYVESEFFTILRSMGNSTTKPLLSTKTVSVLQPILDVFSIPISQLSINDIFTLIMGLDAMLGMDATISLVALNLNKSLFLLDREVNMFATNLNLLKIQMEKEETPISSTDEELIHSYIDKETDYLYERYIQQNISSSLFDEEAYKKERETALDEMFLQILRQDPEYTVSYTEKRNARWFDLLLSANKEKKKLVCVGAAHLPDLFERFQQQGFIVTAKSTLCS